MLSRVSAAIARRLPPAWAFPLADDAAAYAVVASVAGFFLLYGLAAYGILHNNEGLYAEMAREMVANRSPGALTLNGVPYLEKPPLLPWLLAAAHALFGPSELAFRGVAVASTAILLVALVRFVDLHAGAQLAWLTGLIQSSCLVQVLILRTVLPDVLLVMLFSVSMFLFFRWHAAGGRGSLVGSYACLGFAVLAKGFVAPLLGALIFTVFGLTASRAWRFRDLLQPFAIAVLAALALAWPVYLAVTNFDYAWFFVVNEHILRYLGLREPKDYYTGPLYYYLPRVLLAMFPWTVFVPLLAWLPRRRPRLNELEKFAWTWFGVCLVFFSVSTAKGNYYLVIATPPLAFLLAAGIERAWTAGKQPLVAALAALLAVALGLVLLALHFQVWVIEARQFWTAILRLQHSLEASLLVCLALAVCSVLLLAFAMPRAGLCAMALTGAPLLVFLVAAAEFADAHISERRLAEHLLAHHPAARVYLFQDYERLAGVPFYLGREVTVVDSKSSDLLFGKWQTPGSPNFVEVDEFNEARSAGPVVLLVHRHRGEAFRAALGGSGLIYRTRIGGVSVFSGGR